MYDRILFVDFDGTITTEETLNKVMEMCVDSKLFKDGLAKMQNGEWTLREAVRYAFDNISSSRMDDILSYVRSVPIRSGFENMLDEMKKMNIPVVIISGGLKPYVEEKLEPYRDRLLAVHSLETDTSGTTIQLISPFEGETDVIEKTEVMKLYDYREAICVGDGLTDVRMAMSCKTVFARDILAKVLTKKQIPFIPWNDFNDVSNKIKSL